MRFLALVSILLVGCAQPTDPAEALMNKIEAGIVMPSEARTLDQYARYYASERDGSIRVVFTLPFPEASPDAQCDELGKGVVPCEERDLPYPSLKAGERIWLKSSDDLPAISDGGCSVIEFPIPASVIKKEDRKWRVEARCNGR